MYYFLLAICSAAAFQILTRPLWWQHLTASWNMLQDHWPEETTVLWENGRLYTSPQREFTLDYPEFFPLRSGLPEKFAFINTTTESLGTPSALFQVSATTLGITQYGTTQTAPLTDVLPPETVKINRSTLESSAPLVSQVFELLLTLALVGKFLITFLFQPLLRLLFLLPFSWLSLSLLALTGNNLSWKRSYRLGAALIPVAETAQFLLLLFYPALNLHVFWWIWLLLIAVVSLVNKKAL